MKYLKIVWVFIMIVLASWFFYLILLPRFTKRESFSVPDVSNMSLDEATIILSNSGFIYEIEYIDGDCDEVIKTIPDKGIHIYKDFPITIYAKRKVLNKKSFINCNYLDVKSIIDEYCSKNSLKLFLNYKIVEDGIDNKIIEEKEDISSLNLTIAMSDNYYYMPKLIGLNVFDALEILRSYQLNYVLLYLESPMFIDTVIYQSILENTLINKNNKSELVLYISSGLS